MKIETKFAIGEKVMFCFGNDTWIGKISSMTIYQNIITCTINAGKMQSFTLPENKLIKMNRKSQ